MASTQTWPCWWWLWYWCSWSICARYYDDVAGEDEDDVDAPGQLVLTIMMMLLVKMRKHCRISVTWPMMKVGAQFHCCSIHIIHTLPLILIRNGINGICFGLVNIDSIADSVFVKIGGVGQILRRLPRPLPRWCRIFWGPQLSDWCLKVPLFDWLALPCMWNH